MERAATGEHVVHVNTSESHIKNGGFSFFILLIDWAFFYFGGSGEDLFMFAGWR